MIAERNESLNVVLQRAQRGESVTAGLGPFFITINWPAERRTMVCPIPFESVEAAMLCFMENFSQACLEDGFQLTICKRLGSTLVH